MENSEGIQWGQLAGERPGRNKGQKFYSSVQNVLQVLINGKLIVIIMKNDFDLCIFWILGEYYNTLDKNTTHVKWQDYYTYMKRFWNEGKIIIFKVSEGVK